MLTKIDSGNINNSWGMLKDLIKINSIPLMNIDEGLLEVFRMRLISGDLIGWTDASDDSVHTIIITEVLKIDGTETLNLMIVTLSQIRKATPAEYLSMFEVLHKYAKNAQCSNIFCYSRDKTILGTMETFGADIDYSLIQYQL